MMSSIISFPVASYVVSEVLKRLLLLLYKLKKTEGEEEEEEGLSWGLPPFTPRSTWVKYL